MSGSDQPRYCETEGCYRTPDVRLFIGLAEATDDPADDEYRWKCEPCHSAMVEGNKIPGMNVQKIRSLHTGGDRSETTQK